ncbi:MAG: (d)CMP kinase, partial [Candidatus Heimdallarchaeota archaeon]|nr:(d)CMP kinase [Candidatus Heimdallarchaeota archaeon]
MTKNEIITIDGPAGTGKSTVAKLVASNLSWNYLDSGVMYRGLTFAMLEIADSNNVELNHAYVNEHIENIKWHCKIAADDTDTVRTLFYLESKPIPEINLRNSRIEKYIKFVADNNTARNACVKMLQEIGSHGNLVAEGRDQGSVVFTNAKYKFYLDATPEERARRRYLDFERMGKKIDMVSLIAQINERDEADRARPIGALRIPDDAIIVDTTNLSIEQVVNQILSH